MLRGGAFKFDKDDVVIFEDTCELEISRVQQRMVRVYSVGRSKNGRVFGTLHKL